MASEVGSAYVTLLPSAKGFASKMQAQLAGEVSKAGKDLGKDLGEDIGDEAAKASGNPLTRGLGKVLSGAKGKLLGAVGGLAIGGALAKGVSDALGQDALTAKVTAQLGLTEAQSARVGKVAGNLFAGGYGEGIDQINEGIRSVVQNVGGMRDASAAALESIAGKVVTTAQVFDQDMGAVTRAVGQMMKTGMAKNATEALDIITVGFQQGADKSEDFLDTLNEYGTQFRKLGIDGTTATGLISQGLKAGARDGDTVADALKEFSIRAVDGSKASAAGFKSLGLNARAMTDQIAKGGKPAAAGLQTVLDKLRGIKDPVKREAAAVALFGTKAEDMGKALYKLDPSKATKGMGQVAGAADKANKSFNNTPSAKVATFVRMLQQKLVNVVATKLIPAFEKVAPALEDLGGAFTRVQGVAKPVLSFLGDHTTTLKVLAGVFGALAVATYAHAAAMAVSSGAAKAWLVQTKVIQAATKAWAAVQWILNASIWANPITWIVAGIAALVIAVVLIVKKLGGWGAIMGWLGGVATTMWNAVKAAFSAVVSAVTGAVGKVIGFVRSHWLLLLAILTGPFGLAVGLIIKHWGAIKAAVGRGIAAVVGFARSLPGRFLGALRSLGGLLSGLFSRVFGTAKDAVGRGISKVVDGVRALPGKLRALAGLFASAGKHIIGKFVDGLKNAAGIVSGIAGNVWSAVKGLLNTAIGKINRALEFRISVAGKGFTINPPDIPRLASGGRATGATLAVIGEGSEAETVLPDSLLRGLLERTAAAAAGGGGAGAAVFHLYDSDDVLLGTMTGVADSRYYVNGELA